MSEKSQSQWLELVLAQLKADMSKMDDRQTVYLQAAATDRQLLKGLNEKVEKLTQVVSTGNGQPALLVQVADLKRDVTSIKQQSDTMQTTLDAIKKLVENKATPAQKAERWKAVAVVGGGFFALIPGLLALFGVHL